MAPMVSIRPGTTTLRRAAKCGDSLRRVTTCTSSIRSRNITTAATSNPPGDTVRDYPGPFRPRAPPPPIQNIEKRKEAIRKAKPFSEFLTDTFNRQHDYLRISITERCNLRCLYCMPEEGVPLSPPAHLLTTPEIFYLSSLFVSQGVTKIRLTGGEPTVRRDIVPLMQSIGSLRPKGLKELAITTNGISLYRKLDTMVEAGLTGINLSLDTLDPFQFQIMTRRNGFDAVMKCIDRVLEMKRLGANLKLKVNCVVMRGLNERDIIPFVELGREKDIEVRFIEYMPFGGNKWSPGKMISFQEMVDIIRTKYPGLRSVAGHKNDTSKTYHVPGFVGRVGFITSMTNDFCGSCNRLRITSDGNLKVCLHGNAEVSLRDLLRKDNGGEPIDQEAFERIKQIEMDRRDGRLSDETILGWGERERELLNVIGAAVKRKAEKHADIGDLENMENRPMILIGPPTKAQHRVPHHAFAPTPTIVRPWSAMNPNLPILHSSMGSFPTSNTRYFSTSRTANDLLNATVERAPTGSPTHAFFLHGHRGNDFPNGGKGFPEPIENVNEQRGIKKRRTDAVGTLMSDMIGREHSVGPVSSELKDVIAALESKIDLLDARLVLEKTHIPSISFPPWEDFLNRASLKANLDHLTDRALWRLRKRAYLAVKTLEENPTITQDHEKFPREVVERAIEKRTQDIHEQNVLELQDILTGFRTQLIRVQENEKEKQARLEDLKQRGEALEELKDAKLGNIQGWEDGKDPEASDLMQPSSQLTPGPPVTSPIGEIVQPSKSNHITHEKLYGDVKSPLLLVDSYLAIDLEAPVPQLQSQLFELHQRLKHPYPQIDYLPYNVWESQNVRTLRLWTKILWNKYQTRFDHMDIEVDPLLENVLAEFLRDHKLSKEAAERMAMRFDAVFRRKMRVDGHAEGELKWDEIDASIGSWLKDTQSEQRLDFQREEKLLHAQPERGFPIRQRQSFRRAQLPSRQYSTSARPPPVSKESKYPSGPTIDSDKVKSTTTPPEPNALPHLTPSGSAHMVSVSSKPDTVRTAIAVGIVHFSNSQPLSLVKMNALKKGDVLSVSRIAGIMAAKATPTLIPLCHPIALTHVSVELRLLDADASRQFGGVHVEAKVACTGPTGVEMEALTAVMGAGLTVVDMCKAVDKGMRFTDVRVVLKEGGRSGTWKEEGWVSPTVEGS